MDQGDRENCKSIPAVYILKGFDSEELVCSCLSSSAVGPWASLKSHYVFLFAVLVYKMKYSPLLPPFIIPTVQLSLSVMIKKTGSLVMRLYLKLRRDETKSSLPDVGRLRRFQGSSVHCFLYGSNHLDLILIVLTKSAE